MFKVKLTFPNWAFSLFPVTITVSSIKLVKEPTEIIFLDFIKLKKNELFNIPLEFSCFLQKFIKLFISTSSFKVPFKEY